MSGFIVGDWSEPGICCLPRNLRRHRSRSTVALPIKAISRGCLRILSASRPPDGDGYAPPVSTGKNAVLLTRDYETNARNIARGQAALAAARLGSMPAWQAMLRSSTAWLLAGRDWTAPVRRPVLARAQGNCVRSAEGET
jgi:hypothetical protein